MALQLSFAECRVIVDFYDRRDLENKQLAEIFLRLGAFGSLRLLIGRRRAKAQTGAISLKRIW